MFAYQRLASGDVVVGGEEEREGQVERRSAVGEGQDAAVIALVHRDDLRPSRDRAGSRQRHDVGFRAGIAEAHTLDRREALDDRLSVARLIAVGRAEQHATLDRFDEGGCDQRVGMAVEAGAVFGHEVDIGVAVEIGDPTAFAGHERQGERPIPEHGARIAARQEARRLLMPGEALGAGIRKALARVGEHVIKAGVATWVDSGRVHSIKSMSDFCFRINDRLVPR